MAQNDEGHVRIEGEQILMTSFDGSKEINIYPYLSGFDINESIYNSTYTAVFYFNDGVDLIDAFPIRGEEWIELTFYVTDMATRTYRFFVQSVVGQKTNNMSIKNQFALSCTSEGEINSAKEVYTKRYGYPDKKKYHEIISEIVTSDWTSGGELVEVETTDGFFDYVCNEIRPLQAIDLVRERAVSVDNKSSAFYFFQDHQGYHFVTPEKFTDRPEYGPYNLNTSNRAEDVGVVNLYNILAYEITGHGNTIELLKAGGVRNVVKEFDIFTGLYCDKYEFMPSDVDSYKKFGSYEPYHTETFDSWAMSTPATVKYVAKDGTRYENLHNENIKWKRPYIERLADYGATLKVYGNSDINVGDKIKMNLLQVAYHTSGVPRDYFNGTFFINSLSQTFYKRDTAQFDYFMNMSLSKSHFGGE